MKKRILYYILLFISIVFLVLVSIHIEKCEGESYGKYKYPGLPEILISNALFLLIEFVIFTIDSIILITKKLLKREIEKSEIYFFITVTSMLIIWRIIMLELSFNGHCDIIIGPGDTGLVFLTLIAIIVNIWKVKRPI